MCDHNFRERSRKVRIEVIIIELRMLLLTLESGWINRVWCQLIIIMVVDYQTSYDRVTTSIEYKKYLRHLETQIGVMTT